jgi:CHAT domain-containing protein
VVLVVLLLLPRALAGAAEGPADAALAAGIAASERGDLAAAIAELRAAAEGYARAGDDARQAAALLRLSVAAEAQGHFEAAARSAELALLLERRRGAGESVPAALGALGKARLSGGDLAGADEAFAAALARAPENPQLAAALWNDVGELRRVQGRVDEALAAHERSAELSAAADRPLGEARARAGAARTAADLGRREAAVGAIGAARAALGRAGDSRASALVALHLAATCRELAAADAARRAELGRTEAELLARAAESAARSGDARTASFAWGELGALHARGGSRDDALELTRRAIALAHEANAPDSLYRWQSQAGRLLAAGDEHTAALDAMRGAVATLEGLRAGGCAGLGRSGLDFERDVAPVYDALVSELLDRAAAAPDEATRRALLREARDRVEAEKVVELRDYFADACVVASTVTPPDAIPNTVVVYPVLLPERATLIVSLPGGLASVPLAASTADLVAEIRSFRRLLEKRTTRQYLGPAQRLYDWLIRPVEARLPAGETPTWVFVPGGPLRTIPMAALHDRASDRFLVEKYPLAVTPGLTLTDPREIDRARVQMLVAGLTQSVQGFPALVNVPREVAAAEEAFAARTLLDERFLLDAFESQLAEERYGIVHIASHGEFGGGPTDTFLLTYDDKLTLERLADLVGIRGTRPDPLELLTLSACQTATGDDRAALGLAGVAVKAGARSAVATLWAVNDQASAELVAEFYHQLRSPDVSRAEALRRAQLSLLRDPSYRHPGYWAAFLLISNWL